MNVGVVPTEDGTEPTTAFVDFDISGIAPNLSRQERRRAVYEFIAGEEYVDRVDCQAQDVLTLHGKGEHDPISWALAAGLRDHSPAIEYSLTYLEPDELFTQLEEAIDVVTDGGVFDWQPEEPKQFSNLLTDLHTIEAEQKLDVNLRDTSDQQWRAYEQHFNPPAPAIAVDSEYFVQDEGLKDPFGWEG
jgi:hypothetical protein